MCSARNTWNILSCSDTMWHGRLQAQFTALQITCLSHALAKKFKATWCLKFLKTGRSLKLTLTLGSSAKGKWVITCLAVSLKLVSWFKKQVKIVLNINNSVFSKPRKQFFSTQAKQSLLRNYKIRREWGKILWQQTGKIQD